MHKLVISDDEGKTTIVPLVRDEMTIGREEGNTIRLTERNVSRFHAKIVRQGGRFIVHDLASLCGTTVNNRLLKGDSAPVAIGAPITIGDYTVSIRIGAAASIQAEPHLEPEEEEEVDGTVTSHARLVMLTEPDPGQEIDLEGELYVLGRSSESNCQIPHSSVSRAHARLDYNDGKWQISDLDSINGVLINGVEKDNYALKAGDTIELGSVRLRFVAAGEPYDFDPDRDAESSDDTTVTSQPQGVPKKVLYALAVVGVIAVIIIVGMVVRFTNGGAEGDSPQIVEEGAGPDSSESYERLMETGQEKMKTEQWLEAARIFAVALQKNSESDMARDLKQLAIAESEAQKAFTDGLAAEEEEQWKDALDAFRSIAPSSHYYDAEQLVKLSGKLCQELLVAAKTAAEENDMDKVMVILEEIGTVKKMPMDCKSAVDRLWERIEKNGSDDQDLVFEIKSKSGKPSPKRKR
ncbi:MAG: FHA domain-containing protein [Proteobacteria bacterium]|nr:FHA domain-containing protein [Pseudomonadota bacterium]